MIDRIAIDVTNTEQSAVPKEKFRINKYNFGTPFEDLVHNTEPYLHFQYFVRKMGNKEKRL